MNDLLYEIESNTLTKKHASKRTTLVSVGADGAKAPAAIVVDVVVVESVAAPTGAPTTAMIAALTRMLLADMTVLPSDPCTVVGTLQQRCRVEGAARCRALRA